MKTAVISIGGDGIQILKKLADSIKEYEYIDKIKFYSFDTVVHIDNSSADTIKPIYYGEASKANLKCFRNLEECYELSICFFDKFKAIAESYENILTISSVREAQYAAPLMYLSDNFDELNPEVFSIYIFPFSTEGLNVRKTANTADDYIATSDLENYMIKSDDALEILNEGKDFDEVFEYIDNLAVEKLTELIKKSFSD